MDDDTPGAPHTPRVGTADHASGAHDIDSIHDQILAVLEIVPPNAWSLGEASLVLSTLRTLASGRECAGDVVSLTGRRRRSQRRAR